MFDSNQKTRFILLTCLILICWRCIDLAAHNFFLRVQSNSAPYSTSSAYLRNQHLQPIFQKKSHKSTNYGKNITEDTPLLGKYDLSRILSFLRNINLHDDTLLGIDIFNDELTLYITANIKESSALILPDFHEYALKTPLSDHMITPSSRHWHPHAHQT